MNRKKSQNFAELSMKLLLVCLNLDKDYFHIF